VTRPVDTGSSYRLAVSAEMVFADLPFEDRVRRISDRGFEVEIWDWTRKDIDTLAKTGATFSSMTGYVTGTLADPDGAAELLRTAEQSLRVAEELDCPRLNVHGTGLDDKGLPVIPTAAVTPNMWLTAAKTLTLWVPRTLSPHLTSSFAACDTATTAYGRDRHDRSSWPFDSVT
jgi:hydroxypyruvate isomerase